MAHVGVNLHLAAVAAVQPGAELDRSLHRHRRPVVDGQSPRHRHRSEHHGYDAREVVEDRRSDSTVCAPRGPLVRRPEHDRRLDRVAVTTEVERQGRGVRGPGHRPVGERQLTAVVHLASRGEPRRQHRAAIPARSAADLVGERSRLRSDAIEDLVAGVVTAEDVREIPQRSGCSEPGVGRCRHRAPIVAGPDPSGGTGAAACRVVWPGFARVWKDARRTQVVRRSAERRRP